jgi:hypothetical protein
MPSDIRDCKMGFSVLQIQGLLSHKRQRQRLCKFLSDTDFFDLFDMPANKTCILLDDSVSLQNMAHTLHRCYFINASQP